MIGVLIPRVGVPSEPLHLRWMLLQPRVLLGCIMNRLFNQAFDVFHPFSGDKPDPAFQFSTPGHCGRPVARLHRPHIQMARSSGALLKQRKMNFPAAFFVEVDEGLVDGKHLTDGIDPQVGQSGVTRFSRTLTRK